jgi:hypothetical protein
MSVDEMKSGEVLEISIERIILHSTFVGVQLPAEKTNNSIVGELPRTRPRRQISGDTRQRLALIEKSALIWAANAVLSSGVSADCQRERSCFLWVFIRQERKSQSGDCTAFSAVWPAMNVIPNQRDIENDNRFLWNDSIRLMRR